MSAISLKSITGITSITTPTGVDNQLTLHTNDTTERVKVDVAGNVHINNHLAVAGLSTFSTNTDGTTDILTLHADADGTNNGVASIKFVGNAGNHAAFIKGGHTTNGDTILTFHTDAHASGINPEERLRITSVGHVGIGSALPADKLDVHGNSIFGAKDTSDAQIQIGRGGSGNRNAYIDLIGDDTYSDNGLRLIRFNGGANASSQLLHRGTGTLSIQTNEAAQIDFRTNGNNNRLSIKADGTVLIGTTDATSLGTIASHLVVGSTTNNDEVALTLNVMEGTNGRRVKFFLDDDDGVFGLDSTASTGVAPFVVRIATGEKLRIDTDGRLLVGTTNTSNGHVAASKATIHGHLNLFKDSGGDNAGVNSHHLKFVTQSGSIAELQATSEGGGGPSGRGGYLSLFAKPNNNSTLKEMVRVTSSNTTFFRQDTNLEGGEIILARASDNTGYWHLDSYGSSSTPNFRIHAAGASHLSINPSGQWVDAPPGTIIQAKFERYDPNSDNYALISANVKARSAAYIDFTPLRSDSKLIIRSKCHVRMSGAEGCTFGVDVSTNSGGAWTTLTGMVNRDGRDFFYKGETLNHHYTGDCTFYEDASNTNSRRYSPWGQGWGAGTWELSYGHGEHSILVYEVAT